MKTKEELNTLKEEVETVTKKLRQLTSEELESVCGGYKVAPNDDTSMWRKIIDWLLKIPN